MAPDLTLDLSSVLLVRSDIERFERRAGGRTAYGHQSGNLRQGVGYWYGIFEFARQSRITPSKGIKGILQLEAAIAEIQSGSVTFRVPMQKQIAPVVRLLEGATEVPYKHGDIGDLDVGSGGIIDQPTVNTKTVDVRIVPGTRLTVNHRLYQATARAGEQTITTAAPVTTPEWDAKDGDTVTIETPYAVGRIPVDADIVMPRTGSYGGPWAIQWEEA